MKLIYKHDQEHHFKIIRYPDGQQNVELDLNYFNDPKQLVEMVCSIRNFKELEIFLCLHAALIKNDFTVSHATLNYLFGMRCDRAFSQGQPNYMRNVLAPMLNAIPVRYNILYPHSHIGLKTFRGYPIEVEIPDENKGCYVIGADESACWSELYYRKENPHFFKKRTPEGIDIFLPHHIQQKIKELPEHMPLLIKDDLCDGGATFIAIAEYLQQHFPERKRYLFVAHGLFTKGIIHVAEKWDKLITTNSYQDNQSNGNAIEVLDVWT